jgi:hypothetical protein
MLSQMSSWNIFRGTAECINYLVPGNVEEPKPPSTVAVAMRILLRLREVVPHLPNLGTDPGIMQFLDIIENITNK